MQTVQTSLAFPVYAKCICPWGDTSDCPLLPSPLAASKNPRSTRTVTSRSAADAQSFFVRPARDMIKPTPFSDEKVEALELEYLVSPTSTLVGTEGAFDSGHNGNGSARDAFQDSLRGERNSLKTKSTPIPWTQCILWSLWRATHVGPGATSPTHRLAYLPGLID